MPNVSGSEIVLHRVPIFHRFLSLDSRVKAKDCVNSSGDIATFLARICEFVHVVVDNVTSRQSDSTMQPLGTS